MEADAIKRGNIVAHWNNEEDPMKIISDPYSYDGRLVVTVLTDRLRTGRFAGQAICDIDHIVPYVPPKRKSKRGKPARA